MHFSKILRERSRFLISIGAICLCLLSGLTVFALNYEQKAHAQAAGPMGINIEGVTDSSITQHFVDVMMQGRRWGTLNTPWDEAAPADANGWPTADAAVIVIARYESGVDYGGTYFMSFQGQATVRPNDGGGTNYPVTNQVYNSATNTTTLNFQMPSTDGNLFLEFTNTRRDANSPTNTGVTNVKCIRPGYPTDGSQLYTTPFLNAFGPFRTFRTMDMAETNDSTIVNWSDRNTPHSAKQTQKGVAWEYIVALANQLNKDVWINVPLLATDDYVTKLAQLFKYGSDGTNPYTSLQSNPVYAPLNPNLHVYVEYSNEVWNFAFQQAGDNSNLAQADTSLQWDGTTNQFQLATRRVGKRLGQISNIFASVWGTGAINTTVRPVLAWQVGNSWGLQQQLDTISHFFGTPSQYIYALATAPYIHEGDGNGVSNDTSSVDAIINGLYADSDNNRSKMQDVTNLAHSYGLKSLAYEGGTHTPGADNLNNRIAANRDPRMTNLLLHDIGDNWFGTGGDMYMYFGQFGSYSQYGEWGLSEDVNDLNTPKWQAIYQLTDIGNQGGNPTPTPIPTNTPTNTPTPTPTSTPISGGQITSISDLNWVSATNGINQVPNKDKSADGNSLTLSGHVYAKGLGAHAPSTVVYNLNGAYQSFVSDVGVDDECYSGTVDFQVSVDGSQVFDSGVVTGGTVKHVNVSVAGHNQLTLVVTDGGDGNSCDHADWAGAELTSGGSSSTPTPTPTATPTQTATPTPTPTSTPISGGQTTSISDLNWVSATNGINQVPNKDKSANSGPITLSGHVYAKGLGAHAFSTVIYDLNGAYVTFKSDVGVDDECYSGTVDFQVYVDGNRVFDSGVVTGGIVKTVNVSVAGHNELKLVVTDGGDGISCDHADWAGATVQS